MLHQDGYETVISVIDETDGSQADETTSGSTVQSSGHNLSKAHAEELRQSLAPYIKVARQDWE